MSKAYKLAFDMLFEFQKQVPGSKLSERSFEWESGGGNHKELHMNHLITIEGSVDERPFMLVFQTDAPEGKDHGLELFLSAMQVPVDLKIRPRPFFTLFIGGKIKVNSTALSQLLFTSTKEHRKQATALANDPELEIPLSTIDWKQARVIDFQEGAGISMHHPAEMVMAVSPEWLRVTSATLIQLLLVC
jgi:hypothetical protein